MAGISKRTYLREVNPHLICPLCRGYLIDATTVVECLHSFCRSCILKHLNKNAQCPTCKHLINTAKPNIKADKALQDIVYKLVPGLYHKEMRKRREFYNKHPEHADLATPEQRGEDVSGRLIFAPEDAISLSLEYLPVGADPLTLLSNNNDADTTSQTPASSPKMKINGGMANRRYLQCPALVTIAHLKKFLALKYSVDVTRYNIDICHRRAPLPEHWTLMDVAYIFAWKRNAPIRFFYRITQEEQQLEAPPNDRPSTPGLGASQPIANDEAVEPNEKERDPNREHEEALSKPIIHESKLQIESMNPQISLQKLKPSDVKRSEPDKAQNFLVKRSNSNLKMNANNTPVTVKPLPPLLPKPEDPTKQVKSPLKIMKNSDGGYQVLRGSNTSVKSNPMDDPSASTPKASPPPLTPAEFSVVSIADGINSNSVKITLKQCSPGSTNTNSRSSNSNTPVNTSNSDKPKVISNVLLKNPALLDKTSPASFVEQLQEQKQKRKVTFLDSVDPNPLSSTKQVKKSSEQTDKKQFLQGFRLTAAATNQQSQGASNSDTIPPKSKKNAPISVEEQVRSIITKNTNNDSNKLPINVNQQEITNNSNSPEKSLIKKKQTEVKINSTNIADRLSDPKKLISSGDNTCQGQKIGSSNEQQPIDVYAFPNDPPTTLPAGAVKRKCPPGLPISEMRKKQHCQTGKRAGVNTARGGAVKCYRNQSAKPTIYAKPPLSPARPLQNLHAIGNVANVNAATPSPQPTNNSAVSSTSPKNALSPSSMISNDTRNLLDGCGLNIPASLSITLTAPKSPGRANDSSNDSRGTKDNLNQGNLDKLNPSITLNDKSVDPRVLKALKSGQLRIPAANAGSKSKGRPPPPMEQGPSKRKKEEHPQQQQMQQTKNILDLSGNKKMDMEPLRIPTPTGKFKPKPPTWSQANSPKPQTKDDLSNYTTNGQVVTLTGGQRFYRAPPGSLTPAAHRIGDIPTPSRAPVYAPCFSSPSVNPVNRPPPANLSSVFPSLKSLYALSQAPSLEQFHMDSRMRMAAAVNAAANATKDANNGNIKNSGPVGQKSHLAAQCAPTKPARSSVGSFAVPIAKQISGIAAKLANSKAVKGATSPVTNTVESEGSASSTDSGSSEQKRKKSENSKEASSKTDAEQSETCASSTEEGNSHQGAASPRVTSTVSPSPPPNVSDASSSKSRSPKPEKRQQQPSSGSEVTSSNKSPESPDSSSVITESIGNQVDSTKPALDKTRDTSPAKTDIKTTNDEKSSEGAKSKEKMDTSDFRKPMTSEALQKRFLDAFPSNEWPNNPMAAEQFGNFLKSLSSMQGEAQSKNTKTVE